MFKGSDKNELAAKLQKNRRLLQKSPIFLFSNCILAVNWCHVSNQVKNLVRITDFVIIPRYNLNESISQSDTSLSVEDRSASVTQEVRRNNCIFSVTQNTFNSPSEASFMAAQISA